MSFKNKITIVTGAGQGIGLEISRQLVEQEAYVILNDLDPDLASNAVARLNDQYGEFAYAFAGDAGDIDVNLALVQYAISTFGKIDIIIANAGITLFGDFLTYSPESFKKVMQVNLAGTFFLAQAGANQMKLQASGGSILFMSSVTGHLGHKGLSVYGVTKAALEALARNLVIELSQYGININTVAPGATLTGRTMQDENYEENWKRITPNGQVARVGDIANAVLFLVNDNAKHITGQNITVDGGWSSIGISSE